MNVSQESHKAMGRLLDSPVLDKLLLQTKSANKLLTKLQWGAAMLKYNLAF